MEREHLSPAGVKWFPVVMRLYNAFNVTLGATLQEHDRSIGQSGCERSRRAPIVEAGNPLGGSFLPFKNPWILWLLNEQDQAAEHPQPAPPLRSPNQPSGWFLDAAWPEDMEGAASTLAFVIEPSPRTGCRRGECAWGILHIVLPLVLLSAFPPIPMASIPSGPASVTVQPLSAFQKDNYSPNEATTLWQREKKPYSSPHAGTHTDIHTLSSWMAAILVTSPNKVIVMKEMWA